MIISSQAGPRLDANRYATKKTIAQGMLDVALLTANASQLKYILQVVQPSKSKPKSTTVLEVKIFSFASYRKNEVI